MRLTSDNVDLYELLQHENGELLYEGQEGNIIRNGNHGSVLTDILDGRQLCSILRKLSLPAFDQIAVKSRSAAEALQEQFGFCGENPCSQWVYPSKQAPEYPQADVRLLTQDYVQTAAAYYHLVSDSASYISHRIEAARIWGLFEEGRLVGFIGTHSEGAMGMLEVFPEYRRRGYAHILEASLIAWHLKRGWTPYCQVIDGNTASLHLQTSLGMQRGTLPAIWKWKE